MKVLFIGLLFLFCHFRSDAQNPPAYNALINRADLNIVDSLYDSALVYYDKAFIKENKPFAKDYYNAALSAIKVNKYKVADEYLFRLADLGFMIDSLISKKGFEKYVKSSNFKQLIKRVVPGITVFPIKNHSLRSSIDTLVKDDQYFRTRNPRGYGRSEYSAIIRKIDSVNAFKFVALIKKFGFPNESLVGLYDNQLGSRFTNVLIQHQQFASPNRVVDYGPILLDAIKNGEITINNGMMLYALSAGRDSLFGTGGFFRIEQPDGTFKYAYYKIFGNGLEEKFNKNRAVYNMESLEDYRKKLIYNLKDNDEFVTDISIGTTVSTINKSEAHFFKNLTYVD